MYANLGKHCDDCTGGWDDWQLQVWTDEETCISCSCWTCDETSTVSAWRTETHVQLNPKLNSRQHVIITPAHTRARSHTCTHTTVTWWVKFTHTHTQNTESVSLSRVFFGPLTTVCCDEWNINVHRLISFHFLTCCLSKMTELTETHWTA